jgi:MFS family permease
MSQKGHGHDLRIQAFVALLLADFFLTADYSVFPAAVLQVSEELKLTHVQMGLLGTLVYAGLTISSVVSPFLLTRVDSPWPVLSWALVLSAGAAVACAFAPNWYFLAAARFAVGLAHGPMYVFFPVWVNAAAGDGYETRWMGLLQAVGPISNIVCYAGTSMLLHINLSWRVMFLALGAGTFATTLVLSAIPRNVWTVTARSDRVVRGMWSFGYAFWALVIFGAAAYFAACGAEYWAQPALVYLGADVKMAPMGFLAVGVAGPGFGTWFGAHCADQLGGYRKRHLALWFCMAMVGFTFLATPLIFFPQSVTQALGGAIWALFCGSAVMPALNGLILESVKEDGRIAASGGFGLVTTAIGLTLAPMTSGFASDRGGNPLWGWRIAFFPWVLLGPLLISSVIYYERSDRNKPPGAGAGAGDEADPLVTAASMFRADSFRKPSRGLAP